MFKKDSNVRPVIFIIVLSAVLGLSLGGIDLISKEQIEINYYQEIQKSLLYTVNIDIENQSKEEINKLYKEKFTEGKLRGINYYTYKEDGIIKGYCFPVVGTGLWGDINGFIAVDVDADTIIGLDFVRHLETPGLGARIDELWFKEQFRGYDISGEGNVITFSIGDEPGLDTISGATITADSVKDFLNKSLEEIKKIVKEEF